MREVITTLLDAVGMMLLAAAAGVAGWTLIAQWAGFAAAGVVVLAGSWLIDRLDGPSRGGESR